MGKSVSDKAAAILAARGKPPPPHYLTFAETKRYTVVQALGASDKASERYVEAAFGRLAIAHDATWAVGAARGLPVDEDSAWDGAKEKAAIFKWAGFDDDKPDPARARRAFLIYDSDNADLKGAYKLPFATVRDGRLVALRSGLNAAASRLPQTDAPAAVLERAEGVLEAYREKKKEE